MLAEPLDAAATFNGLFEKPTISTSTTQRTSSSAASSSRSGASGSSGGGGGGGGRALHAGPSLAENEKTRSEIGTFLDRLFPHGDFLDGITSERPGRCSFYKQLTQALQPKRPSEANTAAGTGGGTPGAVAAKPRRGAQSPSWMATRRPSGAEPATPQLKAREQLVPASSNGITGLAADDRPTSARQLKLSLKAKSSLDAKAAAEERRQRIMQRRLAEQAEYESSLKTEAELQAEQQAQAKAEARAARIKERQQQQQQQQMAAAADGDGGESAGGGSSSTFATGGGGAGAAANGALSDAELEALREREAVRREKRQAMLQQEAEAAEKAKLAAEQRAAAAEAKRKEQEGAAARKDAAIRQRAEAKQKANEAKAARLRKFQEEKLLEQQAKARKLQAKEKSAAAVPCNAWWCDVAGEGCSRPCEAADYEPAVRFAYGDDYVTCQECYLAHLTEEQREPLQRVDP